MREPTSIGRSKCVQKRRTNTERVRSPGCRSSGGRDNALRVINLGDRSVARFAALPVVGALCLAGALYSRPAAAQVSADLEPNKAQKPYPYFFPFFGKDLAKKGIKLPLPYGIGLNYIYVDQDIEIGQFGMSTNDNPLQPAEFIKFKSVRSTLHSVSVRPDIWVLPMLNVYGIFGVGAANTSVELAEPITLKTSVDQIATTNGFGMTGAFAFWGVFLAADLNFAWTNLEKVLDPVPSRIFSLRVGKNLPLGNDMTLALWGGLMNTYIKSATNGRIALNEVLTEDQIQDINDSADAACAASSRPKACNAFVEKIRERSPSDTIVNYNLEKKPADPTNMLLGAQLAVGDAWFFRSEVGFIGRFSVLASMNYRFGIKGL